MKNKLLELGARTVRWMDLTRKIEKQDIIAATPSRNLFQTWVDLDKNGVKGLDVKILQRVNDEIVHEGDEYYSISESEV